MALKSSRTITKKFANKIKIVREQNSVSMRTIREDEKGPILYGLVGMNWRYFLWQSIMERDRMVLYIISELIKYISVRGVMLPTTCR